MILFFDQESEKSSINKTITISSDEEQPELEPLYNVVLLDDNDHTYDYVIEMLVKLFGHSKLKAFEMACEVDLNGRVVVYTTHKEEAEARRNQILSFGKDWRLERSKSSMRALIEIAQ